jgi:hypothetical protein
VRHAGHRTQRNQQPAATAAPIVGENSIGIYPSWGIPIRDQAHGVVDDLPAERATRLRRLRRRRGPFPLQPALIKAHAKCWPRRLTGSIRLEWR